VALLITALLLSVLAPVALLLLELGIGPAKPIITAAALAAGLPIEAGVALSGSTASISLSASASAHAGVQIGPKTASAPAAIIINTSPLVAFFRTRSFRESFLQAIPAATSLLLTMARPLEILMKIAREWNLLA